MRQLGYVLRRSQSFSGAMTTTTFMMPTSSLLSSSSCLSSTSASKNGKTKNSNAKLLFNSVFVAKMTTTISKKKMKKTTGWCLRALSSLSSSSERNLPSSNLLQVANAFANSIESSSKAEKILRDLAQKISESDRLYYDEAKETLTDGEYDLLRMKFEAVERKFEELRGKFDDGMYARVGSGRLASSSSNSSFEYKKYKHLSPMQSLKNAFNADEVREFDERVRKSLVEVLPAAALQKVEYCAELKIDGVSASLRYENGKLVRALSRGDGEFGEDVTRHVLSSSCRDVPRELGGEGSSYPEVFEIRGEVYVEEDALEKVNERKSANGETPFKNARNAAAGVMRMKEQNVDVPLSFIPHGWGTEGGDRAELFETQIEFYEKCQKWGFSDLCLTRSAISSDLNELFAFHAKTYDLRDTLSHKIDGVVYKINETRLRDRIGSDSRAPKWAIAHKFVADVAITTLKSIEVQVGRTGVLTPVAY